MKAILLVLFVSGGVFGMTEMVTADDRLGTLGKIQVPQNMFLPYLVRATGSFVVEKGITVTRVEIILYKQDAKGNLIVVGRQLNTDFDTKTTVINGGTYGSQEFLVAPNQKHMFIVTAFRKNNSGNEVVVAEKHRSFTVPPDLATSVSIWILRELMAPGLTPFWGHSDPPKFR